MENINEVYDIDKLINDSKNRLLDIDDSEERVRESEVYANLCKARVDLMKEIEKEEKWIEYLKISCEVILAVSAFATAGSRYYEVAARRQTNKEAMFIEESVGRFIPPKWFNNNK